MTRPPPPRRLMHPVAPTLTFETDGTFGGLLGAYAEAHRRRALPAQTLPLLRERSLHRRRRGSAATGETSRPHS